MRVKIVPHPSMGTSWPQDVVLDAATPMEALNGYMKQFSRGIGLAPNGQKWSVKIQDHDTVQALYSPLMKPELHLVPDFSVAGGSPLLRIIVGVVLIVVAVVLSPWTGGGSLSILPEAIALLGVGVGLSLVMGGIIQLMSPAPDMATPMQGDTESEGSRYLGQVKNTVAVGTRIPLAFGRVTLYGHYLSFDVDSVPVEINGLPPNSDQRRRVGSVRVSAS